MFTGSVKLRCLTLAAGGHVCARAAGLPLTLDRMSIKQAKTTDGESVRIEF